MGTASAMPISDRYPSAQMLKANGRLFLIDCGEGCQQQMRRCHFSFVKIEAIFISHTHGDHVFGLFGLLNSMAMYGRAVPLHIYGPQPLGNILAFYRNYFTDADSFEIVYHPLSMKAPELIHTSKHLTVTAFPLQHKIAAFGFRFDEIVTERHRLENPAYRGKSYAYCADTMPFPELPEWVRGVKAAARYHSTTKQAAQCALEAGAKKLVVAHYSSRITDFDAYLRECTEVFPETVAATDCQVFEI